MREEFLPENYEEYLAKPEESLYEHTRELLERLDDLPVDLNEQDRKIMRLACIYHDIGKKNPLFQKRVSAAKRVYFDEEQEVGHNILSFLYLLTELESDLNKEDKYLLYHIVLNHHYYVDNLDYILGHEDLLIKNYQESFHRTPKKISTRLQNTLKTLLEKPDTRTLLLKGFLHKCDYAASAHIPLEIENKDLSERLEAKEYTWNDMQLFAKKHSCENMIIIGSTGLGKTEASLLWQGNQKGFYVLPLKTAINAMYERIKTDFYPEAKDYTRYLGLLHGDTQKVYFDDKQIITDGELFEYNSLTKSKALPLTVCTPDQIFKFAFRYSGYEADLATYSYSKIIIDEIQAYSPDLLATLIFGLQKISEVGGKFAITTATFPPMIRDFLFQGKYDKKIDLSVVEGTFLNNQIRHKTVLREKRLNAEDVAEFYYEHEEKDSVKILVVVNTVRRAQELYHSLKSEMPKTELKVLHSKFITKDRKIKEEEILSDGRIDCKKHVIWIATQVVEASLDIDFDYLFTEFSDLSGLFQRMGRCNRKGKKEITEPNIYVYTEILSILICKERAERGSAREGFIYYSLYKLGKDALQNWADVSESEGKEMTEADKVEMINQYYTTESISKIELSENYASYLEDYRKKYNRLCDLVPCEIERKDVDFEFRNVISRRALPYTIYVDMPEELREIKEAIDSFMNKEEKVRRKEEIKHLKDKFMEYTLSVYPYEMGSETCKLDYWTEVEVSTDKSEYNSEYGFVRLKEGESKGVFW